MPSEANNLPLPPPIESLDTAFDQVDGLVRERQFAPAIELIDQLVTPVHVRAADYSDARFILDKLVARRKAKQNGNH